MCIDCLSNYADSPLQLEEIVSTMKDLAKIEKLSQEKVSKYGKMYMSNLKNNIEKKPIEIHTKVSLMEN